MSVGIQHDAASFDALYRSLPLEIRAGIKNWSKYCSFLSHAKEIRRAVEIVDALTSAATTHDDLAAAIAYFKDKSLTQDSFRAVADHFERQDVAHGPSRALHDHIAYCIIQTWHLEFRVRLVDLRSAAHLNGRAGVIGGTGGIHNACWDPKNLNRFIVRLDDDRSRELSVKVENVEQIRGGDYRRRAR
jgi:hypothetical protein